MMHVSAPAVYVLQATVLDAAVATGPAATVMPVISGVDAVTVNCNAAGVLDPVRVTFMEIGAPGRTKVGPDSWKTFCANANVEKRENSRSFFIVQW